MCVCITTPANPSSLLAILIPGFENYFIIYRISIQVQHVGVTKSIIAIQRVHSSHALIKSSRYNIINSCSQVTDDSRLYLQVHIKWSNLNTRTVTAKIYYTYSQWIEVCSVNIMESRDIICLHLRIQNEFNHIKNTQLTRTLIKQLYMQIRTIR